MRTTRIAARVFGAISLLSALGLLALGGYCYNRAARFKKAAVEAQGAVVELREGSGGAHSGTVYYPVIRFADQGGQERTLYSRTGSYPPAYAVGDRVSVLYDPAAPNEAKVNSFTGLWLLPLILGILGGLDFLTGVFLLFAVPLILLWAKGEPRGECKMQSEKCKVQNGKRFGLRPYERAAARNERCGR